jgi:hypothetical protein
VLLHQRVFSELGRDEDELWAQRQIGIGLDH